MILAATADSNRAYTLTRVPPPPSADSLEAASSAGSPLTAIADVAGLPTDLWTLALPAEHRLPDRPRDAHQDPGSISGDSIFQGPVTGAYNVFRSEDHGPVPTTRRCGSFTPTSFEDDATIVLEAELLRPVVPVKARPRPVLDGRHL